MIKIFKNPLLLLTLIVLFLAACQFLVNQSPAVIEQQNLKSSLTTNKRQLHQSKSASKNSSLNEPITLLGDSVSLGAAPTLSNTFSKIDIDSKVGRQVVQTKSLVESLKSQNKLYQIVILALGTNGPFTEETGQNLINAIGKNRTIYWVNAYGTHLQWQDQVNTTINTLVKKNKNVHLINWAKVAEKNQSLLYSDGIHLKPEAQEKYTNLIKESLGD